jgi:hypothetical protein
MASNKYNSYIRSSNWYGKSAQFKAATGGRCALFPWLTANVSHHLTYDNLESERYIRDCIPLSNFAHSLIHENPIGKFFWKDRLGRRRWMNAFLRLVAIGVTAYARVVGIRKPKRKKARS